MHPTSAQRIAEICAPGGGAHAPVAKPARAAKQLPASFLIGQILEPTHPGALQVEVAVPTIQAEAPVQ